MVASAPLELAFIVLFAFGGLSAPAIGVPLPPDETLAAASPPQCLAYVAYHGVTKPEKSSRNQVEQLLAEDEVQTFLGEFMRLADEGLRRVPTSDEDQRTALRTLPLLGKAFFSRPSIWYVSKVSLPPAQPGGNGGIVLNAGDQFATIKAALDELEELYCRNAPGRPAAEPSTIDGVELRKLPAPPGVPPVHWGTKQPYVFLAVGEGEAAALVARLNTRGAAPAWLTKASADLAIQRPGSMLFVNLAEIWKLCDPLVRAAAEQRGERDAKRILQAVEALGLDRLDRIALMSGLDDAASVSKLLIASLNGTTGAVDSASSAPLSAGDFKSIPADAQFAAVARFDALGAFRHAMSVVERVDPDLAQQVQGVLSLANMQLGFSVDRDLLAGLGDTWSIYNSSREGGLLFTGLCATAKVRDRAKVAKAIDESLRMLRANTQKEGRPTFTVRTAETGSKTISYVQIAGPSPVAPAWCLTDDQLVIALSPSMVRAHLMRDPDEPSLAGIEMIGEKLATSDVTSLSYSNPQLGLEAAYSYVQMLATVGAGVLEQYTDIHADISKFPSLACIIRHAKPTITLSRSTKTGCMFETYSSGPLGGGMTVPAIGFGAGLLLPAVNKAREAGREAVRRNEERQLEIEQQLRELNK